MDRAEQVGLGAAVAAHVALFAVLSYGLLPRNSIPSREAVEVTLTDDVGMTSTAADRPAPLAQGDPTGEDTPTPPRLDDLLPQPRPTPPRATPRPTPTPSTRRTERRPPRPTPPRRTERTANPTPPAPPRRGSRLENITQGIESGTTGSSSSAATVTGAERASYTALIGQQIRPCLNQQSPPGPGAEDIRTTVRIRFNADGTLSGRPEVRGQDRYDSDTQQYRQRVGEQAVASVIACSPMRGLPADLYRTGDGRGWHRVTVRIQIDPR